MVGLRLQNFRVRNFRKLNKGNFSYHSARPFLLFLLFLRETNTCRARIELSRRNKGNKGNLCSDARSLSALSAISAGLLVSRAESFLSHRNKGNKGNSLTRPMRSHFCYFWHFCGTFIIPCDWLFHERVFLSHGKNGKNRNLCSALREAFLPFLLFLRDFYYKLLSPGIPLGWRLPLQEFWA